MRSLRSAFVLAISGLILAVHASTAGAGALEGHSHLKAKPKATTSPTGVTPSQITSYYGLSSSPATGAGQTIAIVDAFDDPKAEADLNTFSSQFGLPACTTANGCFTKVYASGRRPRADQGWALEISLDIQWAHAIAPGAKILLVEAKTNSLTDFNKAEDYATSHAKQVSNSWGTNGDCSSCAAYDSHYSASGVTVLASSGDSGGVIGWPSTVTNVVSVGGTSIQIVGGTLGAESAWSSGGGGPSSVEAQLAAQAPWYAGGKRGTPDVAADADPNSGYSVYDSYGYNGQTGWFQVGGTSGSCPVWAAIVATANASRASPLGGSATPLYTIANNNYPANFKDITTGSNGYPAGTKYDLATGLGSPTASTVGALAAL